MKALRLCEVRKKLLILTCIFAVAFLFSAVFYSVTSETNVSAEELAYTSSSVSSQSYGPSSYTPNTAREQTDGGFIKADAFITAMLLSTIGFVVYIVKNRRHLKAKPIWDE